LRLTSTAFEHGGDIPDLYTCTGRNISPPLGWDGLPAETRSLALVAEDPDTPLGTMTHWVVYNIPAHQSELSEGVPPGESLGEGALQGRNGVFAQGYMGPCPPWGRHRYTFRLYALDTLLAANPRMNKRRLLRAMQGHILGEASLTGRYSRRRGRR
jgi:Raf kinase inhibitor-like YbhB/YbcL family protein